MQKAIQILASACAVASLSACGGSGMPVTQPAPTPVPTVSYVPLSRETDLVSPVVGVALIEELRPNVPGSNFYVPTRKRTLAIDGTFDRGSQTLEFSERALTIADQPEEKSFQGRDVSKYQYVVVTEQFLASPNPDATGPQRVSSLVIAGVPTQAADMPARGTATFRGDGLLTYDRPGSYDGLRADATVGVNFATRRVNVVLTPEGGPDPLNFADRFEQKDMVIKGSRFVGGRSTFTSGGAAVNPLGQNRTQVAEGFFAGLNGAKSGPDEVGGMIVAKGTGGTVTASFVAD